jgi:hypothetical protein
MSPNKKGQFMNCPYPKNGFAEGGFGTRHYGKNAIF